MDGCGGVVGVRAVCAVGWTSVVRGLVGVAAMSEGPRWLGWVGCVDGRVRGAGLVVQVGRREVHPQMQQSNAAKQKFTL